MAAVAPLPIPDPDEQPGPVPAAVVLDIGADPRALDDDGLVAEVTAVERASRVIAARAMRLAVEFARRHPLRSGKQTEDDLSLAALDELSVASGLARGAYAYRLRDAMQLAERFPRLFDAFEAGLVAYPAVRRVLELTHDIAVDSGVCASMDVALLNRIGRPTHPNLADWSLARLQEIDDNTAMTLSSRATRAAVGRFVKDLLARLQPSEERNRRATASRQVIFEPGRDGLSLLAGSVPEALGWASYERIDALARALPEHPEDLRTLDAKRADVYIDLLLGADVEHPGALPVQLQVLIDHTSCRPGAGGGCVGEAGRLGPVTVGTIVDLLALAGGTGGKVTGGHVTEQPCPGAAHHTALGPGAYEPDEAMKRYVRARHRYCAWPGCNRPARACELDHSVPYREGGPTCACNLAPLCVYHHHVKHHPGHDDRPPWRLVNHGRGHLTWVTPSGRRIDVWPDPPDDPDPPPGPEPPPR